jgi:hypothetical protein
MARTLNSSRPTGSVGVVHAAAELEADAAGGEFGDEVAGVGDGAGEPVELGHDEGVAGPACARPSPPAAPVARRAGQAVVDVDPVRGDAEGGETVPLSGEVLRGGGDPRVADQQAGHSDECAV